MLYCVVSYDIWESEHWTWLYGIITHTACDQSAPRCTKRPSSLLTPVPFRWYPCTDSAYRRPLKLYKLTNLNPNLKAQFRVPDSTQLNSTESASVVTQFSSGHVMSTCQYINIIHLITEVMYGIYKSVWKMELQEGKTLSRLPWIWIGLSMDIYVWLISDLGQPRKYDISGTGVVELLMTLLFVSALKTQTSCCYWGCSMISFSFSLPIPLSRRIYPRFSSLEMSAII